MDVHPRAYCDESETPSKAFAIAGYLAPAADWKPVEDAWRDALADEGLSEFHTHPCMSGTGEFEGKTRTERARIQNRFVALLRDASVRGFATVIDLAAYDGIAATVRGLRPDGYWKAYLLAFQHQLEQMAISADDQGISADEQLAFVFDQQNEFSSKAHAIFNSLKRSDLWFVQRLGSLAFVDSAAVPAIQAADLLAYESRKHFSETVYAPKPKKARGIWWQIHAAGAVPVQVKHFNAPALAEFVGLLRDLPDEEPRDD